MNPRIVALTAALATAALTVAPAHGWQVSPDEHAKHHPEAQAQKAAPAPQAKGMAGMRAMDLAAANARLEELVKKMNAAQGQAKVDAIAELLTALVQQHQSMHASMGQMMSTMHTGRDAAK